MFGKAIKGFFLLSGLIAFYALKNTLRVSKLTFLIDEQSCFADLSLDTIALLHSFFLKQHTFKSPKECAQKVQEQFPFIKNITLCAAQSCAIYKVNLQASFGKAILNNRYVLTDHDKVVELSFWNQKKIENLPSYTVCCADINVLNNQCKKFLKNIDPLVHRDYQLEWADDSLIKLHDKAYPHITVFAHVESIERLFCQDFKKTKNIVLTEKCSQEKKTKKWCIDTRFKNQMIVFEGGRS